MLAMDNAQIRAEQIANAIGKGICETIFIDKDSETAFANYREAQRILKERGASHGSMEYDAPILFSLSLNVVGKWSKFKNHERAMADGVMIPAPDFRHGATLIVFWK